MKFTSTFIFCLLILGLAFLTQSVRISHQQEGGEVIDTTFWYRLTTQWQGDGKSLDIISDGSNNKLQLDTTGEFSGQQWKFVPVSGKPGWYRLLTLFTEDKVLGIVNDKKTNNQLQMATRLNRSGELWKLTKQNGWYKLTSMWQPTKSIDIVNDGKNNNHPRIQTNAVVSGQHWKLTKLSKI